MPIKKGMIEMTDRKYRNYWLISVLAVIAATFYPLYMGVRVIYEMIANGTVSTTQNRLREKQTKAQKRTEQKSIISEKLFSLKPLFLTRHAFIDAIKGVVQLEK